MAWFRRQFQELCAPWAEYKALRAEILACAARLNALDVRLAEQEKERNRGRAQQRDSTGSPLAITDWETVVAMKLAALDPHTKETH